MDKLRFNKDARYYRNLLYKNEFRQASLAREIKQVQSSQYRSDCQSESNHTAMSKKIESLQFKVNTLLILNTFLTIYCLKDTANYNNIYDYPSTMFYMWQSYWQQIRAVYESYSQW